MIVTIHPLAESELVDGSSCYDYAKAAGAALGEAFVTEFSRSVDLLRKHPRPDAFESFPLQPDGAGLRR